MDYLMLELHMSNLRSWPAEKAGVVCVTFCKTQVMQPLEADCWIGDSLCCHWQGSLDVNLTASIKKFCHPCSSSIMLNPLSPHASSSFLLLLCLIFFLLTFSSCSPPPQALHSVVDCGFQHNLPLFSTVSDHCLPVFILSSQELLIIHGAVYQAQANFTSTLFQKIILLILEDLLINSWGI
jgi:hypothetical protein